MLNLDRHFFLSYRLAHMAALSSITGGTLTLKFFALHVLQNTYLTLHMVLFIHIAFVRYHNRWVCTEGPIHTLVDKFMDEISDGFICSKLSGKVDVEQEMLNNRLSRTTLAQKAKKARHLNPWEFDCTCTVPSCCPYHRFTSAHPFSSEGQMLGWNVERNNKSLTHS